MYIPSQGDEVNDYRAKRLRAGHGHGTEPADLATECRGQGGQRGRTQGFTDDVEDCQAVDGERPQQLECSVGSCVHAIKGQSNLPGPGDGAARSLVQVRDGGSGAGGAGPRVTAQERLDARNAHLRQSLRDHAERVARADSRGRGQAPVVTAAERLAALRSRVAARLGESRHQQQGTGQPVPCGVSLAPTKEVAKIHFGGLVESSDGAVVQAGGAAGSHAPLGASVDRDATANAATRTAQHGVETRIDGEHRRLRG